MSYREHPEPAPLLIGYDPFYDVPADHLARFVDAVVQEAILVVPKTQRRGQPAYNPQLCIKVLVYGYATGLRSSRQLEKMCRESLPFLFLTRGDTPTYRTLCSVRVNHEDLIKQLWLSLFLVAQRAGVKRLGRIVVDSTKIRADASDECVITADEMEPLCAQIQQILHEAAQADQVEDSEGYAGETRLEKPVPNDQMRDIIRHVRKLISQSKKEDSKKEDRSPTLLSMPEQKEEAPSAAAPSTSASEEEPPEIKNIEARRAWHVTQRMQDRLTVVLQGLTDAIKAGEKYLNTTDLVARMMGEGRSKRIMMCHAYEVAVDQGLLVAAGVSNSPTDSGRLLGLVEQAKKNEPEGVQAVDADSGYYSGRSVTQLVQEGIDVCIPNPMTACDLRKGLPIGTTASHGTGKVPFEYMPDQNHYVCPQGNILAFTQLRTEHGVDTNVYRAKKSCHDCKLASLCLTQKGAKRRTLKVAVEDVLLKRQQKQFNEKDHVDRYHRRADAVETVFGFARRVLGFNQWTLRGDRIGAEGSLLSAAYQFRKVHLALTKT